MAKTLGSILQYAGMAALAVTGAGIGVALINGLPIAAGIGLASAVTGVSSSLLIAGSLLGLQGIVGGPSLPKPDTTQTAIKTSRPPRVSMTGEGRLYGAYCLYETASDGTAIDIYAVHDGVMAEPSFYLGDEAVTLAGNTVNEGADGRYRDGAVKLYWTDGSTPGTANFAAIKSLLPTIWTDQHRGDGVVIMALTAAAVKAKNFQETYPSSSVPMPSIVAKWNVYPDPAAPDPASEAAWNWTENSLRHLLWYILKFEGADYATKIAPTLQFWIDAAADCDVAMSLKAGGNEARYRGCVAFKHTDPHKDVKAAIASTFDGWIAPRSDGALVVYSGRYYEPTVSIGPEEIVSYSWDGAGVDDDKAVNEIICSYVSAEHDYNTVECDAWRDEADISARGQELSQPLEAQVPSHAQARRLAKRKMARGMAQARGTITTNVAGRIVRGERYINLRIEEAGAVFYDGPAEIVALTRNMATGGVTFDWIAADPNIDAWNPATEEGDPAAKGDRVPSQPLTTPEITTATFDGETLSLDVTGPVRSDLTWFVQMREQGAAAWGPAMEWPDIDAGDPITLEANVGAQNAVLEVQVAYAVSDGRTSDWSATEVVDATETELILVEKSADMTVSDRTALKTSGAAAWSPGVRSAAAITGSSRVRFKPARTDDDVMIALNAGALADDEYFEMDFALSPNSLGQLDVYESSGAAVASNVGTYAAGEELWIEYDSAAGEVRYYSDAGATLLLTKTGVAAGLTLYLDSVFYDVGARVDDLRFEPL